MKIDSSLLNQLPEYHVCLGVASFALGAMAKDNLPQTFASSPVIQLPCAFFSAGLIPLGSLLALRELMLTKTSRKNLLSYHLVGLVFIIVMLSFYFYSSLIMDRMLGLPNQLPSILPKLTENARSLPNEQKRMMQAQWAYRLYGVIIAYRLDNLDVAYYIPTEEDKSFLFSKKQTNAQSKATITFIRRIADQCPYLFGLYAATYLATFVVGWIWLLVRMPKYSPQGAA